MAMPQPLAMRGPRTEFRKVLGECLDPPELPEAERSLVEFDEVGCAGLIHAVIVRELALADLSLLFDSLGSPAGLAGILIPPLDFPWRRSDAFQFE